MKASIYTNYGSPDVLRLAEIEKPVPKDNEVLVKVYATTVNRTDCATMMAKPFFMRLATGLFKPKKTILGTEFSGEIKAVGKAVKSFHVGDRVFGFDDLGICSHAQYLSISEEKGLATIPEGISYSQAAASIEGAHYAYNFINKVNLKSGQKILVNGATGGIGSALVQLLNYFGADVTAVGNTKNMELVKSLGANKVIDYLEEDFTKEDQKYDCVFDAVGKSTFGKCKPLLPVGGIYISSELGPWWQNIFFALLTPIFGKKKVLFPYPADIKRTILLIKKLMEEEKFKAVIDRTYSLEEIAEAFRFVAAGKKTGNVVIRVDDGEF